MTKIRFSRLAPFALLSGLLAACGGGAGSSSGTLPVTTVDSTPSVIQTSAVTNATATSLQTSGSIAGLFSGGFTLSSGAPHGYVHIYTNANTRYGGAKPFYNEKVTVAGTGSWSGITASTVTQAGTASPTPAPTSNPGITPPNGSSTTPLMPKARSGIGLFQVFDAFYSYGRINPGTAVADGSRYDIVWGARPGMASSWRAGNSSLIATYYMPQETDASYVSWGGIGHDLAWWQAHHPDWVLYSCTAGGAPTKIPAMIGSLPQNVPLDIHNPEVVNYQIHLAANYAIANGYNGLAYDEVVFYNLGGVTAGTGAYGCGIYQNGTFVRRYSGKTDARWNADTVAWVKAAHQILTTDSTLAPHHLKLVVNHPAGNINDPNEQGILANVDADLDETGFADYSNYTKTNWLFKQTVDWMRYAQAHGTAPLIIDKYYQSASVNQNQLEYGIATYLMGNEGGAGLFVGNNPGYGIEQYHSEYTANYGTACGAYYGGSATNPNSPDLWYRRYSNAFVVVNGGSSSRSYESVTLPAGHSYRDLEGRPVSNPLSVANHDAYVLLTTNGCN